jgi:acyl-coenzyme A synthetase/AMP-(fatty) acid ligase
LVTTPYHLDKLVESEVTLPQIDRIVCATAPLSVGLAIRAEATYRCELLEIFGSTETGQIAYRRTTQSNDWQLMGDLVISSHDQGFAVRGEHLPNFVHLTDIIEIKGAHSFELIGRSQDMVNIAGKRSSLTYLNTILRSIPGLREGVFFSPSTSATDQNRLALIYVSDTLTEEVLRKALRQFIEPVFLPRPMIKVEEIPRNPTGKVLQNALDLLVRSKLSHGA